MIDFILFFFVVGVFYAGFYCGGKYGSLKAMLAAWKSFASDLTK